MIIIVICVRIMDIKLNSYHKAQVFPVCKDCVLTLCMGLYSHAF